MIEKFKELGADIPHAVCLSGDRGYNFGLGAWLLLGFTLVLQLIAYDPLLNVYDEGVVLVGANSVLHGKLPYKDFWTMYGPGSFYLASFLFYVFEPSDFLVRIIGIAAKSFIAVFVYVIIDRFSNRLLALGGAVIVLGMVIGLRQDAFPVFPAVAFALGTIIFIDKGLTNAPADFLVAGLCTGIAACFRHDLGFYTALAVAITILLVCCAKPSLSVNQPLSTSAAKPLGYYVIGISLLGVPIGSFFLCMVPLSDLYENLIIIPSHIYPEVRHLPWPGIDQLKMVLVSPYGIADFVVYVPFLVCASIFVPAILRSIHSGSPERLLDNSMSPASGFLLLASFACLLFTLKGIVRVSSIHMIQSLVLCVPLLLVAMYRNKFASRSDKIVTIVLIPALGLLVALSFPGFVAMKNGFKDLMSSKPNIVSRCIDPVLPTLRCVSADRDYLNAAKFVREKTMMADRIYVGGGRHDKIFANAVAFYFFAERQPSTKWYELHPGIQTQARIQAEMISEMEMDPPRMIIIDERWDYVVEPNLSSTPSGVRLLDNYLERKYVEKVRFGAIRIFEPRDVPI